MAKTFREPSQISGVPGLFSWAKDVVAIAILGGRIIKDIDASTTPLEVDHGLGRVPRGLIVVKNSTTASYATGTFTKTTFTITASTGTPTVSVWIF